MGGTLTRAGLVFVMLMTAATPSRAAVFDAFSAAFFNSNLTFGGATYDHYGYDLYSLRLNGVDYTSEFDGTGVEFAASGGVLVQTTPVLDANGNLVRTQYHYEGGTFALDGIATAPVVSLLVSAAEPLNPGEGDSDGSGVLVTYVLGPGTLDDAIANMLGIPTATGTGAGDGSLVLLFGDHQSPQLVADDGGFQFWAGPAAAVPEPSLSMLIGLGLAAVWRARRRP
jgi:hypothetical protein